MRTAEQKRKIQAAALMRIKEVISQYEDGLLTLDETINKILDIFDR